jgi:hypothetical protein
MTRPRPTLLLVPLLLAAATCGKQQPAPPQAPTPTPAAPAPPPAPTPPPPGRWSLAGRVVDTVTGVPVPNATIEPTGFPSVTTNESGEFFFQADMFPQFSPFLATVSAGGFITREAQVTWARERTGVDIGLIRDAPPFSLDFYRQLVRNGSEPTNTLQPLRRWTEAPRFHVRTLEEGSNRPVEPEVLAFVRDGLVQAVAMWTGWTVPAIEMSPDTRADTPGWIRVVFIRTNDNLCGQALVGRNPGLITFTLDGCDCGSRKVSGGVIVHEVGHAMGFWHVRDRQSVMFPIIPGGCPSIALSPAERHHSTIAYRRLPLSVDVDRDYNQTGLRQPPTGDDVTLVDN